MSSSQDQMTPVNFCDYFENNPRDTTRFCPVPKVKGIYYPSQQQIFNECVNGRTNRARGISTVKGCGINKKLPGTLGNPNAISANMRHGKILSANNTKSGVSKYVFNSNDTGERYGQPGGITPPIRNRF